MGQAWERLEAIVKEYRWEIAEALQGLNGRVEFAGVIARKFKLLAHGLDISERLHLPVAVKIWSWRGRDAHCDDRFFVGAVGNTYPIKDRLKASGYRYWNAQEPAWIKVITFDPADGESFMRGLRQAVELANETRDLLKIREEEKQS